MQKLTIKDIAQMAGVSYATVSRALNGEPYVKSETYERIMAVCRKTGYTPNAIARQLKSQKNNTIGIIVPDISNVFFSEITKNIEWNARMQGYNVFISSSFYDYGMEEKNIQVLLQNRVDGIIIAGVGDRSSQTILSYVRQIPMVSIGDNIPDHGVSHITVDNQLGTSLATDYLLGLGHRSIVFLGGRVSSITHRRRQQGFLQTVKNSGASYEIFTVCDGSKIEDGYKTGCAYFKSRREQSIPYATAAISVNDNFALGVMQAASEFGINIPLEFSIVGFDNISFAALPRIHLTTVSQPKHQICEYALKTLLEQIENQNSEILTKIIEPTLIVRDTCAQCRESGK